MPFSTPVTADTVAKNTIMITNAACTRVFSGNREHVAEAEVELDDPDSQAGSDTEDRAQHRGDIHGMPNGTMDFLAEDGIERAADGQRQIMPVAEER